MALTEAEAAKQKARLKKRADEIDEPLARDRELAKARRKSAKKGTTGKRKSVWTVRG